MPRRPALIGSALCWAGFALVAWLMSNGLTQTIDHAGLLLSRDSGLQPSGPPFLLEAVRDITALGGTTLRLLAAAFGITVLLMLGRRRPALFLGVAMIGGLLVNTAFKHIYARPRPDFLDHLTNAGGTSFPSGHSFGAITILLALALVACGFANRSTSRCLLLGAALVLGLCVAWSRVWLGVHYPSDVLAGWLGGIGWTLLVAAFIPPAGDPGRSRLAE